MTQYSDYKKFLYNYNLTGNAPTTAQVPTLSLDKENGDYIVTFSIFDDPADISSTYYLSGEQEQTHFATSDYISKIATRFKNFLSDSNPNDAQMLFADVANISFSNTDDNGNGTYDSDEDIGTITLGQLEGGYPDFEPSTAAFASTYADDGPGTVDERAKVHGDIWANIDNSVWTSLDQGGDISPGDFSYKVLIEEAMHALGVDVIGHDAEGTYLQSQKYTVTARSDNMAPGMDHTLPTYDVAPYNLQLMDIAAIQEIYGRNYDKAPGSTNWTISTMQYDPSDAADSAFLYTIWDGSGSDDNIDASELDNVSGTSGVEIDLRQGRFSSIGEDVYGNPIAKDEDATSDNPDPGNVAIAYNTVIENAIGTNQGDTIVGNAWDNTLKGGSIIANDNPRTHMQEAA